MSTEVAARMEALVIAGPNQYAVETVDVGSPGPGEVLCKVHAVSICGTDSHLLRGDYPGFWPPSYPFTSGHEWAGEVVEVGGGTEGFGLSVGTRVAGTSHAACGYCARCVEGRYNVCENYGNPRLHRHYGHNWTGALAQYVVHNIKAVFPLPDELDYAEGALLDPASIALHTANRGNVGAGDVVLILGAGPIGLLAADASLVLGASRVVVAAPGPATHGRLGKAVELGHETLDTSVDDVPAAVRQMTGGRGADVVLDCAGVPESLTTAIASLRRGGRCVVVGIPVRPAAVDLQKLVLDEMDLVGVRGSAGEMRSVIPLVRDGRIRVKPLITHHFPLREFAEAVTVFDERRDGAVKVVIHPW
ncbi:MAG TPA: alcohol dehydrogenase catalytic domain-containing protein [Candidatus Limnocylindrales bacterium]|nr:alcohol dehydrogenase catalytic domain-containing protein [Candidatus Limnocylindrales bacterium]